jgi:uncharacterized protein YigE (DUF2233 family)
MKLTVWKSFFVVGMGLILNMGYAATWRTLTPGLEYTQLSGFHNFPAGYVHAFRIDLNHYQLKIGSPPRNIAPSEQSFQQLMHIEQAVVASNAGFFTPELKPLGLRISAQQTLNPLRAVKWWPIFFIQHKKAHVVRQQDYQPDPAITFAIQAGPALLTKGKVLSEENPKIAARTALGITTAGKAILLATQNVLLSVADLTHLMRDQLDCVEAINLDGGSSTQLYAALTDFSLQVPSYAYVADAVLVVPAW